MEVLLVLDFGSQYTQLIARRVRELGVYSEIVPFSVPLSEIKKLNPKGIILSGGPQSVYAAGAPKADKKILELGIPVLGICYGLQWLCYALGGRVAPSREREFGKAKITIKKAGAFFKKLSRKETVWMSHGDKVVSLPKGFSVAASSDNAPFAAIENKEKRFVGIQFHPEVSHTPNGGKMLKNFLFEICGFAGDWKMKSFIEEKTNEIKNLCKGETVICALSGGVDSSVVATLVHRAVGDALQCIFVDTGLLRLNEDQKVMKAFREKMHFRVKKVNASELFLRKLKGVVHPEKKRKIIGNLFIEVFAEEARKFKKAKFLAQGTLYPDVIESISVKGPSATIKTHHNVGGLPKKMPFALIEPVRMLFKDEVRAVGRALGLSEDFVGRHPFPGPGLAVRIIGEVSAKRVAMLQMADDIFISELYKNKLYHKIAQALAILLPVKTVGVMGDERTYENVVALRAVTTEDFMTADWARIPDPILHRIATRIVNEVKGVNRVVYDITTKPPATVEWE